MASSSNIPRDPNATRAPQCRGVTILKTVSLLLVRSRKQAPKQEVKPVVKRPKKMDESTGKITPKLIESLKKRTHFTKKELMSLCKMYRKLVANSTSATNRANSSLSSASIIAHQSGGNEGVDRHVFRELMHSTFDISSEEMLIERIFVNWEKGNEGSPLRLDGWITGLSTFLRGSLAEKAAFCFRIYDLNNDTFITKDEMFALMKNCLIKQPQDEDPDESVRDLMEIVLRKFDLDKDGKISYLDYLTTVTDEPLLLEALGQCLPSEAAIATFLATFD